MLDRHRRRKVRNFLARRIGPPLVRLWALSLRLRWYGCVRRKGKVPVPPGPGVFVFWHQRLLAFGGYFRNAGYHALVSRHGDGELLAGIISRLGVVPVRGSTRRGGTQALREILALDKRTLKLAITPDGPQGPRHHFHPGPVYIAQRTGLPIYPATVAFAKAWSLPTWDGFLLPLPGSRALARLGDPVFVPEDLDREGVEAYRVECERRLRELTEDTDRRFDELYAQARRLPELPEVAEETAFESDSGPIGGGSGPRRGTGEVQSSRAR